MQSNSRKLLCGMGLFASLVVAFITSLGVANAVVEPGVEEAHTEPSKRISLHFREMGIIRQVAVKDGEVIKANQVLMSLDDDIERDEYDRLKADADSPARMEYYQAAEKHKKYIFEHRSAAPPGVFSINEVKEAELDWVQSIKQIDVAKLEKKGEGIKANQQLTKLTKMKLLSPIDGIVEKIQLWEGELATPDKEKPVIVLVKNDPCDITLQTLYSWQVAKLSEGETLQVRYVGETDWREAKITYIAPVAVSASDNQVIRLQMPNPDQKKTGLPVHVKLPAKLLERTASNR